jgi:gamma-glutamylcyclotransferase (GGCT)/AIG2-like uncharacterized protein YtfP
MQQPSSSHYIFAYGGNTNLNHLNKQYPGYSIISPKAMLMNYRLVFQSYECVNECCTFTKLEPCYCNIVPTQGSSVQGVLIQLSEAHLQKMDVQECVGCIYERVKIQVSFLQNNSSTVECWTYRMIRPKEVAIPSERYLGVVKRGYEFHDIPLAQLQL